MKQTLHLLPFFLFVIKGFSQETPDYVTVDINKYTATQLVTDVLLKSSNVNISDLEATASCGFGYFNRNNSDFPFKEGMIIRNGKVENSEGKYDGSGSSTTCSNKGDAELQAINCANGNCNTIQDASSIKFRFIAGEDKFSFRYLFASNEYGAYQCSFSDAFAFILKDETTGTPAQNLAVIPGTTTPVLVTNIRKQQYNPGCGDINPSLFGQYNVSPAANVAASDINMSGQTVVMTASATVIPGHIYSIKLVIGDYTDTLWDSAVFIEAGSVDFGQSTLGLNDIGFTNLTYNPNPVLDVLNISTNEIIESVSVTNLLGQELRRDDYNASSIKVDMNEFAPGTYIVKAFKEGKCSVLKIIKR